MTTMVKLLLELGGDLSAVNVCGNDFVAIAASTWTRGLWDEIIVDVDLLKKCTARHAGRVALQLFATWVCSAHRPAEVSQSQMAKMWCGEQQALMLLHGCAYCNLSKLSRHGIASASLCNRLQYAIYAALMLSTWNSTRSAWHRSKG